MKDWFELKYFLYFRKKRLQSGLVSTSRLIECATCLFIYWFIAIVCEMYSQFLSENCFKGNPTALWIL